MTNSKQKGKRGELEVAKILREHGFEARRSAQYCGNTGDAPDIITDLPFHIEVKHQETLQIDKWWEQACNDAKTEMPLLVFRKNNQKWRVCLGLDEFLEMAKKCFVKDAECVKLDSTKKGEQDD